MKYVFPSVLFAIFVPLVLPAESVKDIEKVGCSLIFYTLKPRIVYLPREMSDEDQEAPIVSKEPRRCHFRNGKKWSSVTLDPGRFSGAVAYRGAADVRLFDHQPEGDPASAEATAEVRISPAWKQALVVLTPGPEEKPEEQEHDEQEHDEHDEYDDHEHEHDEHGEENADDDEEKEPAFTVSCHEWKALENDSLRLLNQTETSLEIMIGETEVLLASNQTYDYSLGQNNGLYLSTKIYQVEEGEERRLAYSRKMRINREGRSLILLQSDDTGRRTRLRVTTLSLDSVKF